MITFFLSKSWWFYWGFVSKETALLSNKYRKQFENLFLFGTKIKFPCQKLMPKDIAEQCITDKNIADLLKNLFIPNKNSNHIILQSTKNNFILKEYNTF